VGVVVGRRVASTSVESGYRIFRLGALIDALDYYEGFRYSETVEVAVVRGRLGYRLRTDIEVTVPVSRSRTRIVDAVIDVPAIPCAAVRVLVQPARPADSSGVSHNCWAAGSQPPR
jgi:hypothetical protein